MSGEKDTETSAPEGVRGERARDGGEGGGVTNPSPVVTSSCCAERKTFDMPGMLLLIVLFSHQLFSHKSRP